jgi:hypothetical protein
MVALGTGYVDLIVTGDPNDARASQLQLVQRTLCPRGMAPSQTRASIIRSRLT